MLGASSQLSDVDRPPGSAYFVYENRLLWHDHVACDTLSGFHVNAPGDNKDDPVESLAYDMQLELTSLEPPDMPGLADARRTVKYYGYTLRVDDFVDATIQCDQTLHGTFEGDGWTGAFNCPISR